MLIKLIVISHTPPQSPPVCFRYVLEYTVLYAATMDESHTPSVDFLPFFTFTLRAKKKEKSL